MDTNRFNQLCCSILGMSRNENGLWVSPSEELQWLCTELNFSLDYGHGEPYKFHSDWRWLMEVMDVIETTDWDIRWNRSWDRIRAKWGEDTHLSKMPGQIFVSYDNRDEHRGWWCSLYFDGGLPTIQIAVFDEDRFKTRFEATRWGVEEFLKIWDKHLR